mmetsp:Transcript_4715/g.11693  ORF Transcript_4715/g.11693 Transcript_4715/m.11693 type:complete len:216 (+) Transcript_4715:28-675(+)
MKERDLKLIRKSLAPSKMAKAQETDDDFDDEYGDVEDDKGDEDDEVEDLDEESAEKYVRRETMMHRRRQQNRKGDDDEDDDDEEDKEEVENKSRSAGDEEDLDEDVLNKKKSDGRQGFVDSLAKVPGGKRQRKSHKTRGPRQPFTLEEKKTLIKGFQKHGTKWAQILHEHADYFGTEDRDRTSVDLKDLFRNLKKKYYDNDDQEVLKDTKLERLE